MRERKFSCILLSKIREVGITNILDLLQTTCFSRVFLLILFSYRHLECTTESMITISFVLDTCGDVKGNTPSEHHVSVIELLDSFVNLEPF